MIRENVSLSGCELLILAGGKGTRLASVWKDKPKILAPVAGRPYFDWLVDALYAKGFRRFVFLLGAYHEQVLEHSQSHCLRELMSFEIEERALGTGGAISAAARRVEGNRFFALNGDSYCNVDYDELTRIHASSGASATIALARAEETSQYGSVTIDGDCRIGNFAEKLAEAGPSWVNAGVYLLEKSIFEETEGRAFSIEKELFPRLVADGRMYGAMSHGPLFDIGTPDRLELAQESLASIMLSKDQDENHG